jgi:hypothetical protein
MFSPIMVNCGTCWAKPGYPCISLSTKKPLNGWGPFRFHANRRNRAKNKLGGERGNNGDTNRGIREWPYGSN